MRSSHRKTVLAVMVMASFLLFPGGPVQVRAQSMGQVITPSSLYKDAAWRDRAGRYQGNLARLQSGLTSKFRADSFRLLAVPEAAMGGIGFWGIPASYGDPNRFVGIMARVNLPPPSTGRPFDQSSREGRLLTIMDAYGKDSIQLLAKELSAMPDQQVAGAAIIFIYSPKQINDPAFEQNAEALVLYILKPDVIKFADLSMTLNTLFSRNVWLQIFEGQSQVEILRTVLLVQ